MDKVIDSPMNQGGDGLTCGTLSCNAKIVTDKLGNEVATCEGDFKSCIDCFTDGARNGGGICRSCKEPFRMTDLYELFESMGSSRRRRKKAVGVEAIEVDSADGRVRSVPIVVRVDGDIWVRRK
ncbi:hypothetical protein OPV22_010292 [Ensete ventricosum]|uniref:Uncharacterized protein n=1 Tax=Ensete ventricosum TaxID=4639 RepID=A0AAV8RD31_ENSVE|nr:hypothetical protein OPV22_010292 [Ensete ventricosum]